MGISFIDRFNFNKELNKYKDIFILNPVLEYDLNLNIHIDDSNRYYKDLLIGFTKSISNSLKMFDIFDFKLIGESSFIFYITPTENFELIKNSCHFVLSKIREFNKTI